jgi:hypothetical protein
MNWLETIRTGLEAVRSHRLRSGLTVLGILIGIAAVILTVGLGLGAQQQITQQINSLGSNLLIVAPGVLPAVAVSGLLTFGDDAHTATTGSADPTSAARDLVTNQQATLIADRIELTKISSKRSAISRPRLASARRSSTLLILAHRRTPRIRPNGTAPPH